MRRDLLGDEEPQDQGRLEHHVRQEHRLQRKARPTGRREAQRAREQRRVEGSEDEVWVAEVPGSVEPADRAVDGIREPRFLVNSLKL